MTVAWRKVVEASFYIDEAYKKEEDENERAAWKVSKQVVRY